MRRWALWANSIWKCIIILCWGTRRKITLVSNKVTSASPLLPWKKKKAKIIPFYQQLSTAFQTFHIKTVGLHPHALFYCAWHWSGLLSFWAMCPISVCHRFSFHPPVSLHPHSQGKDLWLSLDSPQQDTNTVKKSEEALESDMLGLSLTPVFQQGGLAQTTSLTLIFPSVKWD